MKACSVRWPLGVEIEEALGELGFLGVRLCWELWVNVALVLVVVWYEGGCLIGVGDGWSGVVVGENVGEGVGVSCGGLGGDQEVGGAGWWLVLGCVGGEEW